MDRKKLDRLITDNMKSVFGFALTRLGSVCEAEELASDILYEIIKSADKLHDEERFFGFMWKIAENTYKDHLRKKSKAAFRSAELDENLVDEADAVIDDLIRNEELNVLRRELSLLSKDYRDATVMYYIEDLSCSEIAEKLHVSTEMVKYYLFRARNIIREGMNMERLFGEKSYRPAGFEIDYWGPVDFHPNEYGDFQKRKIKGNILLAAYYTPMTLQEISIELGVALPYLEDEVRLLEERRYLICKNNKYLTNIPIFTQDCTARIDEKLKVLTENAAKNFISAAEAFSAKYFERFDNENLLRWQMVLLCMHFSLMDTEKSLKAKYGQCTDNGLGVIWGRHITKSMGDTTPQGIQGIYNGAQASDKRGSVIAMNFGQTLNAQHFEYRMTDPLSCVGVGCYSALPAEWQKKLSDWGYVKNGNPNFQVWSIEEYHGMRELLENSIVVARDFNEQVSAIAAEITADLAPVHIRKTAEYVGASVYRFHANARFVDALYDMQWLKPVDGSAKPAVCVVKY